MKRNAKLKLITMQYGRFRKEFRGDHILGIYYGSKAGQYCLLWLKGTITSLEKVIVID